MEKKHNLHDLDLVKFNNLLICIFLDFITFMIRYTKTLYKKEKKEIIICGLVLLKVFLVLGKLAAVFRDRFSINDLNFRSIGKEIRSLTRS